MRKSVRHPWKLWFALPEFVAVRGVDFHGRTDSFIQLLRNSASKAGVGVSVEVSPQGCVVTVRVRKRDVEEVSSAAVI